MNQAEIVQTCRPVQWTPAEFRAAKGERSISLCFPCRDEMATIGSLVARARAELLETGCIDEVVVLDDRSTDDTPVVALAAGAKVLSIDAVHLEWGEGHGKGNALWASLLATSGGIIVWCDGDVTSFSPEWVIQLVAPLLAHPELQLVKAAYERPETAGGGGRTTELVARPLLSLFAPALAPLAQPLAGEFAARRDAMEAIPFAQGWGAEIGMLFDVAQRWGARAIAQVDIGVRIHRHRSLRELSIQAAEVMAVACNRLGKGTDLTAALSRSDGTVVPLNLMERQPIVTLRSAG